jgi:Fe-S-cluster containining protein
MKIPIVIPIINKTENEIKFNCNKCGACCRAVNCQFLTKDNLCSIYETRPLICNIEKGYEQLIKGTMTKEEFFKLNEHYCNVLKDREK